MPNDYPSRTLQLLAEVPAHLAKRFMRGEIERTGVILRDANTKSFVAHLQPSRELVERAAQQAPPASSVSGLGQTKGSESLTAWGSDLTRNAFQFLNSAGSVAAMLNLAVTVGGFALVRQRLNHISDKVDAVLGKLDAIHARQDIPLKSDVLTAARRSEDAFLASPRQQRRIWQDAERTFDQAFTRFLICVTGESLDSPETAGEVTGHVLSLDHLRLDESLSLLDWLAFCARGRVEALYLLEEPALAAKFAAELSTFLGQIDLDSSQYANRRIGDRIVSSSLRSMLVDEAERARALIDGWRDYADHVETSATVLDNNSIDTHRFVMDTREYPAPTLLYLPLEESADDVDKTIGPRHTRTK